MEKKFLLDKEILGSQLFNQSNNMSKTRNDAHSFRLIYMNIIIYIYTFMCIYISMKKKLDYSTKNVYLLLKINAKCISLLLEFFSGIKVKTRAVFTTWQSDKQGQHLRL